MKMPTVLPALLMVFVIFPSMAEEQNERLLKLTKDRPKGKLIDGLTEFEWLFFAYDWTDLNPPKGKKLLDFKQRRKNLMNL